MIYTQFDSSCYWKCDVVLSMQILYISLKSNIVFEPAWLCMYYIQCVSYITLTKLQRNQVPFLTIHLEHRIFTTQSHLAAHSERPTVLLQDQQV